MTFDVNPIEAVWLVLNLVTFAFTLSAFVDARADRSAVKLLNGHARELIADGTVRREGIRLAVQVLLLVVVVPGLFSSREIVLSVPIAALMVVPVLLLGSSFFDARDRKALTVLVAADIVSDASRRFDRLEQALTENTAISSEAVVAAERAYHEANDVNNKIARQQEAGLAQGQERKAAEAALTASVEDTQEKVTDLHEGRAPERAP